METGSATSDMGIGMTVLFSILALLGVVGMFAAGMGGAQLLAAAGFAVAVVAACFAVSATHIYS